MPIPLRGDFDAPRLRAIARGTKDAAQTRRLLALAAVYDGARRTEAAAIGGVTLQIVRDWGIKFNAHGPRSGEHTSGIQPHFNLVCRLLLVKKKQKQCQDAPL